MLKGSALLHEVSLRILVRYLRDRGYSDAIVAGGMQDGAEGIDLFYSAGGRRIGIKVKADSYYGTDPAKIANRELIFYRTSTDSYGLETIADSNTRQPGWVQRSRADELYYYCIALGQTEDEVSALMEEPDEVFFGELKVERDNLRIVPMPGLRAWFDTSADRFATRPVLSEGRSAWYRIVPRAEVDGAVAGIRDVGAVFGAFGRS
ncbi:MAG: hypothetical protein Q8S43_06255 [Actinomycetota bacterium]|nr:MAG: hypothetical protein FD171_1803 [Actinomycetota bacterium]MDO8949593.1 hypothetical protein [Actinomycetota bacterium]MDP3630540.1 hypothetical protein [Actinomycetota bacterium]